MLTSFRSWVTASTLAAAAIAIAPAASAGETLNTHVAVTTTTVRAAGPGSAPRGLPHTPLRETYLLGQRKPASTDLIAHAGIRITTRSSDIAVRTRPIPITVSQKGAAPLPIQDVEGPGTMHYFGDKTVFTQRRYPDAETLYARTAAGDAPKFTIAAARSFGGIAVVTNHDTDKQFLRVTGDRGSHQYYELTAAGVRGASVPAREVADRVFAGHRLPAQSRFHDQ